ncbi:MAG: YihY/virulence factor BrkB family protein [Leptospirales bacterium]|nr:YihY/virulence factor BrkB family protein [Leptospirales bacterium]
MARRIAVGDLARSSAARAREALHSIDALVRDPAPAISAGATSLADLARILRAATQRYLRDGCVVRANAIAYSIVISIIPLLTLLVRFATIEREDLSRNIARFLAAYGLTDASQVLAILDEILSRSYAITGVGVLFMLFSAVSLLQHVESSFNHIYRARKQRPIVIRVLLAIAAFTLLPLLSGAMWSGARYLFNEIRPPEYSDILSINGERMIAVSTGEIRVIRDGESATIDLRTRIDARAPMREVYVDLQKLAAGPSWRTLSEPLAPGSRLAESDFFALRRLTGYEQNVYAMSESGIIFYSYDGGRSWNFETLLTAGERAAPLSLLDIRADRFGRLQILANADASTLLLTRDQRGREIPLWTVRKFSHAYQRLTAMAPIPLPPAPAEEQSPDQVVAPPGPPASVLNQAPGPIALLGRGRYLLSLDDGQSWAGPFEAISGGSAAQLSAAATSPRGENWFAARNGAFWIQTADGPIAPDLDLDFGQYVQTIRLREDGVALVAGAGGLLRISFDAGRNWRRFESSWLDKIDLIAAEPLEDGGWLLAGEQSALAQLSPVEESQQVDGRGRPLARCDLRTIVRTSYVRSISIQSGLYLLIFLALLGAFTAIYLFFPNTRVEWRPAVAGAGITATALLLFVILFRTWAANFTAAAYIYGVWAALPLGMIVILASTQIILFGLQTAYVVQHPYLYRSHRDGEAADRETDSLLWNSAILIALVYHKLYREKRPLTDEMALYFFERKHLQLDYARERIREAGLIAYEPSSGEYFPVRPPGEITIALLQRALFADVFQLPDYALDQRLRQSLAALHARMSRLLAAEASKLSVADLVPLLDNIESLGDLQERKSVSDAPINQNGPAT